MSLGIMHHLPPSLREEQRKIEGYAREAGLDFFPTVFEVVDCDQLNAIASRGGFPTRYPHWRFGMEYEQLSKSYSYGLSKIYEMVINNDPCYAYLLSSNALTDQKLVMAHVYGHCDFFKNNAYFAHTNRKMMDEMANHGNRIRAYMDRHGVDEVENFVDACLSVEDLIDIHSPGIRRASHSETLPPWERPAVEDRPTPGRMPSKAYLDPFVNPRERLAQAAAERQDVAKSTRFPERPLRDVLLFMLEHAPLVPWQVDVLSIVRDEAYYFAPQGQTKIMNEGWASFWHSRIMTTRSMEHSDVIHYCDHHSGTLATSANRLNPYKLGIELFRDIEDRWNKGKFGKEYDECDDWRKKQSWDTKAGLGREKIFEARKIHNDLTFIDTFLTLDFCREQKLFSFGYNASAKQYEIESREFPKIKARLLNSLTNMSRPIVAVLDGNYENRGELLLEHQFDGVELDQGYAQETLKNLYQLWMRPVHVQTMLSGKQALWSYTGKEGQTQVSLKR